MRIGASRAFGLKLRIFLLREAVDRRSSADINEAAVRLVTGLLEVARAGKPTVRPKSFHSKVVRGFSSFGSFADFTGRVCTTQPRPSRSLIYTLCMCRLDKTSCGLTKDMWH